MDTPQNQPIAPGPQLPQERHEHTQLFIALGAVVVLALLFLGGLWFVDNRAIESVEVLESGETLTTAKEGRVVPGFPEELLSEGSESVENSYSLEYESGIRQPVVRYRTALSLTEAVERVTAHFESQGWSIAVAADPGLSPVTNFYAVKGNNEANVTFNGNNDPVTIEIAIVLAPENSQN